MSDNFSIILNALATLQEGQVALRDGQDSVTAGQQRLETRQERLETRQERLAAGQERLEAGQERLEERQDRLEARVEAVGDAIATIRSDFLTELGKTRADLMHRMQTVRDDVTVNLAAAQLAKQGA